jgi:lipoprotein-anchoring transpeptidase ErfK/SrfK
VTVGKGPLSKSKVVGELVRTGRKDQARFLLLRTVGKNPNDFKAWLWLAGLADSTEERMQYIARAESLHPNDPILIKARIWAQKSESVASIPDAHSLDLIPVDRAKTSPRTPSQNRYATREKRGKRWRLLKFGVFVAGCSLILLMLLIGSALVWNSWQSRRLPANGGIAVAANPSNQEIPIIDQPSIATKEGQSGQVITNIVFPDPLPAATMGPLQPKNIINSSANVRATWTATPLPTNTPIPSPTPVPTFISELNSTTLLKPLGLAPNEKWIDVNLTDQHLVAYEGDLPVFDSAVSSGTWSHPTVMGQFRIWLRFPSQTMNGYRLGYDYYLEGVPYVQYFYQDYALHGTYWHNNFGTPMSHGCVNLPTSAAEWLFNFADYGTLVNIHQ